MGLVLDAFDSSAFGSHHQSNYAIWYAHLNSHMSRYIRWRSRRSTRSGTESGEVVLAGSSDLGKVFGSAQDFPLGFGDVFFASGNHEDGLLASDGRLDVCVCFRTQGLDFAA